MNTLLSSPPQAAVALSIDMPQQSIAIQLERDGNGYSGRIGDQLVELDVSDGDLQQLNGEFVQVLDWVRHQLRGGEIVLPKDAFDRALDDLRYAGRNAFERIFGPDGPARDEIDNILSWGEGLVITVLSDGFPFFWEMLYSGEVDGAPNLDGFWGSRHIIARRVLGRRRTPHPIINRPTGMLLIVNQELPQVMQRELPQLQAQAQAHDLRFRLLDEALPRTEANGHWSAGQIIQHLSQPTFDDDLVHFACHAMPDTRSIDRSRLEFTVDGAPVRVRLADLRVFRLALPRNSLIFLNGCWTNCRVLLQTQNFVDEFMVRGARGVIATECTMPDSFAAAFAAEFYAHFLDGERIGEALWQVRRHFLERCRNPLGLAYALYADSQTRIVWRP